jgi:hypothetical protein
MGNLAASGPGTRAERGSIPARGIRERAREQASQKTRRRQTERERERERQCEKERVARREGMVHLARLSE